MLPRSQGRRVQDIDFRTLRLGDVRPDSSRPSARRFTARRVDATHRQGNLVHASRTIPRPRARRLSRSLRGRRSFYPRVRRPHVALSRQTVWRRVSRRALRCGQPFCVGQGPRRHGLGEHPCMQQRFPAVFCRLLRQGLDHRGSASRACRRMALRSWHAGARVAALERPPS